MKQSMNDFISGLLGNLIQWTKQKGLINHYKNTCV